MSLAEDPAISNLDPSEAGKELWDYDAFVSAYNEYATSKGGWVFEEDRDRPRLEEHYFTGSYKTIREYAEACVGSDQFTS